MYAGLKVEGYRESLVNLWQQYITETVKIFPGAKQGIWNVFFKTKAVKCLSCLLITIGEY